MIVMKFGGSSVGDDQAIRRLVDAVNGASEQPLVVVSALSGMTDTLLGLEYLEQGERSAVLQDIRRRHLEVAEALELEPAMKQRLQVDIDQLAALMDRAPTHDWTSLLRDQVAAWGELLSSVLVAAALKRSGLDGQWFDARRVIRTDAHFGSAIPDLAVIRTAAGALLAPLVEQGQVVVTQGFIGSTEAGQTTTLGRGGSDFTAALLGAALRATRVEIWTDVDGLMSADPRLVPNARLLRYATYDEAAELASFGAKVLHPATQLPLSEAKIPILIRNTFAPDHCGTEIREELPDIEEVPIRSIAFRRGATILQVRAARMLGAYGFLRRIFEVFEKHEIVVDVLASSEVSVSLTVNLSPAVLAAAEELRALGEVSVVPGYSVVALIGRGLRETPGISARAFGAIADVNVAMTSQGASATNLTFLVKEEEGAKVIQALHRTFFPEVAA